MTETKQGAPDFFVKNTKFPKYKPAFNDILCDSEGNIWVHTFLEDTEKENRSFDVFDENGEFISRVKIEENGYFPRRAIMKGRSFYILETGEKGYSKIVKYRISE